MQRATSTFTELMTSLNAVPAGPANVRHVRGLLFQVVQEMVRLAGDDHCYDVSDWHFDNVGVMGDFGGAMAVVLVDWQGHEPAPHKTARQRMKGAIAGKNGLQAELANARFFDDDHCGNQWRQESRRAGAVVQQRWSSFSWFPDPAKMAELKGALGVGLPGEERGAAARPAAAAAAQHGQPHPQQQRERVLPPTAASHRGPGSLPTAPGAPAAASQFASPPPPQRLAAAAAVAEAGPPHIAAKRAPAAELPQRVACAASPFAESAAPGPPVDAPKAAPPPASPGLAAAPAAALPRRAARQAPLFAASAVPRSPVAAPKPAPPLASQGLAAASAVAGEDVPKRARLAEPTPNLDFDTPPVSPTPAPMLSEASRRHIAHVSQVYLHGLKVTDRSMPLPDRQQDNVWVPGVAPHAIDRDSFSATAHLVRVFLGEFAKTTAFRERIADPKPRVLTAAGEGEFIGRHAKGLSTAAGGRWFQMAPQERLAIFDAYLRRGLSTAPARHAGHRMEPADGERSRRCDWFSSPQAAGFYMTEEETAALLGAVAAVYISDLAALRAPAWPSR